MRDTQLEPVLPLVPEISLHLARNPRELLRDGLAMVSGVGGQPYWAFAWPGGQAISRFILDTPSFVAGKRVLDVGSGSAIEAIAAMKAGARHATAADTDPRAAAAAELNGRANAVTLHVLTEDLLDRTPEADLVIIGDLAYAPDLAVKARHFLDRCHAAGIAALLGDREATSLPGLPLKPLASYRTVVCPPLEEDYVEEARVWLLV
jgi:predicted nicotinamide N-methyase